MNRRQFVQGAGVATLGLLAGCGISSAPVQQPPKVPRVGFLSPVDTNTLVEPFGKGCASWPTWRARTSRFSTALRLACSPKNVPCWPTPASGHQLTGGTNGASSLQEGTADAAARRPDAQEVQRRASTQGMLGTMPNEILGR